MKKVMVKSTAYMHIPMRNLGSSSSKQLAVPVYNLRSYAYRAFSYAAPLLWNSLPPYIRLCDSLTTFKKLLKTYLFKKAFYEH